MILANTTEKVIVGGSTQRGKRAHLLRFSNFSGNFPVDPVGRTNETCSIYRRTGNFD